NRRLFLPVKNNLAPLGKGLAFRLEQRLVDDPAKAVVASSVVWETEPVTITADQALQAADDQGTGKGGGKGAEADAEDFLRVVLAAGPVAVQAIETEAKEAGHSWATVRRAKDKLGVVAVRVAQSRDDDGRLDGHGHWQWSLTSAPPDRDRRCSTPTEDAHLQNMSAFGENEHVRSDDPPKALITTEDAHHSKMSTFGRDEHPVDDDQVIPGGNGASLNGSPGHHPIHPDAARAAALAEGNDGLDP